MILFVSSSLDNLVSRLEQSVFLQFQSCDSALLLANIFESTLCTFMEFADIL